MSAGPDLSLLSHEQKDALIHTLMAQVAALTARVAELEAKLGLPPKTPDNSSVPPSKGQKASEPSKPRPKANPHAGAHRPLHPNPTRVRLPEVSAQGGLPPSKYHAVDGGTAQIPVIRAARLLWLLFIRSPGATKRGPQRPWTTPRSAFS